MLKRNYKVRRAAGSIETHEIFLDTLAHEKEEELGLSEKKFEISIKDKLIYAIFGIFAVCVAVVFGKTLYLQAVQGKELYTLSERNKGKISFIRPERGIIYDKNYKKLVVNSPAYDLVCDKRNFSLTSDEYRREIEIIGGISGLGQSHVRQLLLESEDSTVVLMQNIEQEKLLVLEASMHFLPDCTIEKNTIRGYAMGPVFSHVLGYTGKVSREDLRSAEVSYTASDYIGKSGIEKSYEKALRGIPGRTEVIRHATGIQKGDNVVDIPKDGNSLVLNIDAGLQKAAYDSLEKNIKNVGAKKGAAVAINPQTGAVLALVSYPAYDDNMFSRGISQEEFNTINNDPNQPFFNRAIAAKYPTGSTIKPFLASGALQESLISPEKQINDPGYIVVHSQNDPSVSYRFAGVVPHGWVDMRKAIAVSSNVYFYTIGGGYGDQQGLGPARIKKYLDMYGWEQKTGIDLPGEFKGFVPSPEWKKEAKKENWWDGDTYNLSIGQSDLQVTPLQVAVAYCAIANGGTLYKPQIVQKIIDTSGGAEAVVREFTPEVAGKLSIDPEYLQIVREGMRDGVRQPYGSSYLLNSLPISVAGKTGTAETGKNGVYNTWSSNFAPYENPEIVFVATIEGVPGLRSATLPVANEVLYWYFTHK